MIPTYFLRQFGLAAKTTIVTTIVILFFLCCISVVFLYLESELVKFSGRTYARSANELINDQVYMEQQLMDRRMKAYATICGNIASAPLYNFDSAGLRINLTAFMALPTIKAIFVRDNWENNYLTAWKDEGIHINTTGPGEQVVLSEKLAFTQDSFYKTGAEKTKVGTVTVYFTDEHLLSRIQSQKKQIHTQLESHKRILGKRFNRLAFLQITLSIAAILLLMLTIIFTLRRNVVRPLREIIGRIRNGSEQITMSTGQITEGGKDLAQNAWEQAAAIKEVATALEQMSSATQGNAADGRQADELMKQTHRVIDKTRQSIDRLTDCMENIRTTGEKTQKIVKTIDEIAFQTNLLALNAAIEAARAGETGAGFSVVADEVRSLAIRAGEAAQNTADLIDNNAEQVTEGIELVGAVNRDFVAVGNSAVEVETLIGQISTATMNQADEVALIDRAMAKVDKITRQNAAAAEESAGASEELNAQTINLHDVVRNLTVLVEGGNRKSDEQSRRRSNGLKTRSGALTRRKPKRKPLPMSPELFFEKTDSM